MSELSDRTDTDNHAGDDHTKKGVGRRAVLLGAVGGGALATLAHAAPAAKHDNLNLELASFTSTLDGLTSMYGLAGSPTNHAWRARWDKFRNGNGEFHLMVLADSLFGGWDGAAYHFDTSILRSMGRELCGQTSTTFAGGVQLAGGDSAGHVADNVALTGVAFSQGVWIAINGTGTITVTLKDPGTSVAFAYADSPGTNSITWKIDGVTQSPVARGNTPTIKGKTVSGLSAGMHTLEFDNTSGIIAISGWRCWTPNVSQLHTHVGSIGGTRANSGTAAINWSDTSSTGVGYVVPTTMAVLGAVPDLVICCAGANDIANSVAPATAAVGLATMRNYYSTSPAMLVAEPMVHGANLPNTQTFLTDVYTQGDTLVVPVFDLDNYFGAGSQGDGNATANADNLLSPTDLTHPLQFTQQSIGQHLAAALLGAA